MTDRIVGGCKCGLVRYKGAWLDAPMFRCHCRDCQQFSGADNLPQVGVPAENLIVTGPVTTHRRTSASGNDLTFSFCADCGAALFKSSTMASGVIFLCAGSLSDPPELTFEREVHTDSARRWAVKS